MMAGRRPEWLRPRWPEPDGDALDDPDHWDDFDILDAIADERDRQAMDEAERRIDSDWFDVEVDP